MRILTNANFFLESKVTLGKDPLYLIYQWYLIKLFTVFQGHLTIVPQISQTRSLTWCSEVVIFYRDRQKWKCWKSKIRIFPTGLNVLIESTGSSCLMRISCTHWGHVLSLITFCRIPVMSWEIRYATTS